MTNEEANIKVSSLQERYGLDTLMTVYNRLRGLGIKPVKGSITQSQLELMDRLDVFLSENPMKAIADFPLQPVIDSEVSVMEKIEEADNYSTISRLMAIVEKLVFVPKAGDDTIANFRDLEEAAANVWLLPTATVKKLIGVNPYKKVFVWGSFTFTRSGRIGNQSAWKVTKTDDQASIFSLK